MAQDLTLGAEDANDLQVLSARLQDALARVGELTYLPRSRRFVALFNRYRWEADDRTRVRSGFFVNDVTACKAQNILQGAPEAVVSLLAIRFFPAGGEHPGGEIELVFSGGGAIRLTVECIDAGLTDLSGEWDALRPTHEE